MALGKFQINAGLLLGVVLLVLLLGYLYFYVNSRSYLNEGFQGAAGSDGPKVTVEFVPPSVPGERPSRDAALYVPPDQINNPDVEPPYVRDSIQNLDDYELNLVYKAESDRPLTKALRDKLMSQYPMDWTGNPPSSTNFQEGLREFFENPRPTVPDDAKPYQSIAGSAMAPPDVGKMEAEERKILQTYKPTFPPSPTAYDPADVQDLIKKIYDAKGEIAEVKQRDGTNVYEIIGTRKKDEKVVYEDEEPAPAGAEPNPDAGEGVASTPGVLRDIGGSGAQTDTFFEEGSPQSKLSRTGKWDYTAWTPGLERMFAPTSPKQNWH